MAAKSAKFAKFAKFAKSAKSAKNAAGVTDLCPQHVKTQLGSKIVVPSM